MFKKLLTREEFPPKFSADFLEKISTISKQSIIFFSGNIFTSIIGYIFTVYVARTLGSQVFGLFAIGMSIVNFIVIISTFGLPRTSTRYVALYTGVGEVNKLTSLLSISLLVIIPSSILFGVVIFFGRYWIAENIFHESLLANFLRLFAILIPVIAVSQFLIQVLTGYQRVDHRSIIDQYLRVTIKILVSVSLITLGLGLSGWIIGEICGGLVSIIIASWLVIRLTPSSKLSKVILLEVFDREFIIFTITILGINLLSFIWSYLSQIILGIYLTAEQVGVFSAAITLGAFIPVILNSVNHIFAPIVAELQGMGQKELLELLYQTLTKWIIALTWPFAVVIVVFAPMIMFLYGEDFEQGWFVLVIIAIGQIINAASGSNGLILVMSGKQRLEFFAGISSSLLFMIISVILIPSYGILGAGLATTIGIVMVNLIRFVMINKVMGIIPYNINTFRLLPASVISGFLVFIFHKLSDVFNWHGLGIIFFSLIIAYISFFLIMIVYGLDDYDRQIFSAVRLQFKRRWSDFIR